MNVPMNAKAMLAQAHVHLERTTEMYWDDQPEQVALQLAAAQAWATASLAASAVADYYGEQAQCSCYTVCERPDDCPYRPAPKIGRDPDQGGTT